jgi:hypothetical protein
MFNNTMHLWLSSLFFFFAEHHKHVRKTRGLLDAFQPNTNRLCLPQRGKIVAAKAKQRAENEVETVLGDSEYDSRLSGYEKREIRQSAEQHESRKG